MAKKWSNKTLPGSLHYVTGNVNNRRQIFLNSTVCEAFLTELQQLRTSWPSKLAAFVLMPEHFHLVSNPQDGQITEWVGALKSVTAKRITRLFPPDYFLKADGSRQVWQESFKAMPLWSNWMIWQKINYIHNNPLKAGLVDSTAAYQWSSFKTFYKQDDQELLRVDNDWWWPDDVQKLARAMAEWSEEKERGQSHPS